MDQYAEPHEYDFFDYIMRDTDAFTKALFDAIFYAPSDDRDKLNKVYPEYVECVRRYQTEPDYFRNICEKVKNS
jgi:hypothetical protein